MEPVSSGFCGSCAWTALTIKSTLRKARSNHILRERLAIGPHCAILEIFLLPDRHRLLNRVDQPSARVERRQPMRRVHRDHHARLADLDPPDPVHDGDVTD